VSLAAVVCPSNVHELCYYNRLYDILADNIAGRRESNRPEVSNIMNETARPTYIFSCLSLTIYVGPQVVLSSVV